MLAAPDTMPFLAVLGVLVILVGLVEALWTTLWVDGGAGPVTQRYMRGTWRLWRGIVGARHQRLLSLGGPLVLSGTFVFWLLLLLAGWWLVFSASPTSIRVASTGLPTDATDRVWFVVYTMFTVGNGDFTPSTGGWQVAASLLAMTGMTFVTLGVTYLLSVLSAVITRRAVAAQVAGLGEMPEDVVRTLWTGRDFSGASVQLTGVVSTLERLNQQHLAYPVLHFYHSADRATSTVFTTAVLDDALTLLRFGVAEEARPAESTLQSARSAVQRYLGTVSSMGVDPAAQTPPSPRLDRLRAAGIPVVDDERFGAALEELTKRRRLLLGAIQYESREWPME